MSLKIYIHSTCPWGGSSYSVLAQRVIPEMVRMGHGVALGTWYGLQGAPQNWPIRHRNDPKGAPVGQVAIYPCVNGAGYALDTFLALYQRCEADVAIPIMDIWVIPPQLSSAVKMAPWFPVDHDPCPKGIVDALSMAVYPMTYSKWGVEVLKKAGIEAHYVPCSADKSVYLPMPMDKAREKLGLPKEVGMLVAMVAANKDPSDRKGFGEAMTAFAEFSKAHEDAYMYLHTHWDGPVNIGNLAKTLGIENRVIRPDPIAYLMGMHDEQYVRAIYCAADVLLNPAKSEGFGLPILEAQMCGCPVALTDFSTTDELLFAGWKISGQRHWSAGADSFRLLANLGSIVEALEAAYADKGNELLRRKARQGAIAFDTELVAREYWKPALAEIEKIVCSSGELKMVTF